MAFRNPAEFRRAIMERVLLARIGWMQFYNGSVPGDEKPVGGGSFNKQGLGHEVLNFRNVNGRCYGYFAPTGYKLRLERIDPGAPGKDELNRVLIVFVAKKQPVGGQVVVGWYKDAKVLRNFAKSPGKPRKYHHLCSARASNCVLLPVQNREFDVPRGRGNIGTSNAWYPLDKDGEPRNPRWLGELLEFVRTYEGANLLFGPEAAAEEESTAAIESALARSQGQGFARTAEERKLLEAYAMKRAIQHFQNQNFDTEDVSKSRPYDLKCTRRHKELHVEVKGTTTIGNAIILTSNEVKHALNGRNECVLFLLHSIQLNKKKATGGEKVIIDPWKLKQASLKPLSFMCRLR
jgi:Domain of unknown function (DUF3883)